ncbi:sulfite exporter TauE/SafE family protein [Ruicaihuangia caeni]|uniref:Probable membrane transporter protein n=1 Tax=Ruicaihuangia caeni TaxID=3042517 RepID=A0AAW6T8K0_9MICO|nr:sulfite exporter TauE/SafE family protein [Klugiella sp. YN-L-19]MDI2099549.1 sulfite exporter TauE/SafE family protein [Klugiella sp. YN-L-19]
MSAAVRGRWWRLAIVGLLAGFFSGLFGVGGGVIIVPLLLMLANFEQRRASGTSLTAILPTAIAGAIGYAVQGEVDWIAAGCLAGGAIVGSLIGSWLLHKVPQGVLRWLFIAFLVAMAIRMFLLVPDRGAVLELGVGTVVALIGLGLVTGILSGLLGVGGGVVVVPMLMVLFGMGDLVAKGTSLLMMIPTSITGTLANVRRGNSDVRAAAVIGLLAVPASLGGVAVAAAVPPQLGAVLFAALLVFTAVQLAVRAVRQRRRGRD